MISLTCLLFFLILILLFLIIEESHSKTECYPTLPLRSHKGHVFHGPRKPVILIFVILNKVTTFVNADQHYFFFVGKLECMLMCARPCFYSESLPRWSLNFLG
jgi:hypothetical protein